MALEATHAQLMRGTHKRQIFDIIVIIIYVATLNLTVASYSCI